MSNTRKKISNEMNALFADSIFNFLHMHKIKHTVVPAYKGNYLEQDGMLELMRDSVQAILLQDNKGVLMAVFPGTHFLDVKALSHLLGRDFSVLSKDLVRAMLFGCSAGVCPPLAELYGVDVVFDSSLQNMPNKEVYFATGQENNFVKTELDELRKIFKQPNYEVFAEPVVELSSTIDEDVPDSITHNRIKSRLKEMADFPVIPVIADAILHLRVKPNATSKELADIVERDPSLTLQVMRWAKSSFYGYEGELDSVQEAIDKVLGFDLVMNLTLCLVVDRTLTVPLDGEIGVRELWRSAIYTAVVAEALASFMPQERRLNKGQVYLSGILHNFGYFLLGQLFPHQYKQLADAMAANLHVPVSKIEQKVIGVGHGSIAAWLFSEWNLSSKVIAAAKAHNLEHYAKEDKDYPNLLLLALRLLRRYDIGSERTTVLPVHILRDLGLDVAQAEAVIENVMRRKDELDGLINNLIK